MCYPPTNGDFGSSDWFENGRGEGDAGGVFFGEPQVVDFVVPGRGRTDIWIACSGARRYGYALPANVARRIEG